ncbi:MAG: prepilin-type N-terminal cleavage/methylation domain-containing protein [Candidatus Omnitrophica bacterium]|nr:prepilin-type N-terminal cleavage/methylation domain-containing protein [Candidatus Omnitrophota bacterium]
MYKEPNKKGFTLIELMVSCAILVVFFVGMVIVFVKCMQIIELAHNSSSAVSQAKNQMEKIRKSDFSQLVVNYDNKPFNVTFDNVKVKGKGVTYVDDADLKLPIVRVNVSWKEKSGLLVGEDSDLTGAYSTVKDKNGNGRLDSPVSLEGIMYDY